MIYYKDKARAFGALAHTNYKILSTLKDHDEPIFDVEPGLYESILTLIMSNPNKRFGQLLATYIIPDYLEGNRDMTSDLIMNTVFEGGTVDPYFEEPEVTLHRLENIYKTQNK